MRSVFAMRLPMRGSLCIGLASGGLRFKLSLPNNQTLGIFLTVGNCLATSPFLPENYPYRRILFKMGDCIAGLRQSELLAGRGVVQT